ncbi:MAG: rhamnogalacturonan acetylesterase [Lachnospiraceae bacterium]|nr:rhamnogalacturonan acetylesterase [Lachnospiraceae bacterium]
MKRILYAGDSTVTFNKIATYPQTGLSQGLTWYLKDDVFLKSFAVNGRSTKSFIDEGRFELIENEITDGDFLFIQFGHNDEKESDPARYAAADTDFKDNLARFVNMARKHGAMPVIITPLARRKFDEKTGAFIPGSHGKYPGAAKDIAGQLDVPVADLNLLSESYLAAIGDFASRPMYMYPKDNSHLSVHGAVVFAGFIADELIKLGEPYSSLFVPRDSANFDTNSNKADKPYIVLKKGEERDGSDSFKDETAD